MLPGTNLSKQAYIPSTAQVRIEDLKIVVTKGGKISIGFDLLDFARAGQRTVFVRYDDGHYMVGSSCSDRHAADWHHLAETSQAWQEIPTGSIQRHRRNQRGLVVR